MRILSRAAARAALLLTSVVRCSAPPDALPVPAPTEVPLQILTNGDGDTRMLVHVQLGDAPPILALLDTGSSGLRVLGSAIPPAAFASVSATPAKYAFGVFSGSIAITGVVAYAQFTIGDRTTDHPIGVMVVETGGCSAIGTNCVPLDDLFSLAPAILGVGMQTDDNDLGNPIAQLPGHPPFVVHIPDARNGETGTLRIGALATDALAFESLGLPSLSGGPLPDGTPLWNDAAIPCCVSNELSGQSFCLTSRWDTGNPSPLIEWPGQPSPLVTALGSGSIVSVSIGSARDLIGGYTLVVGTEGNAGTDAITVQPTNGSGSINLGVSLFYKYDALFDQAHGVVGLAQR